MPFIEDIIKHTTLSIIGMDKNCGKTVVLNYILNRLRDNKITLAITSIGVDGERVDIVSGGKKPEITLEKGTIFATAETLYTQRRVVSELLAVSDITTAIGDVVIAKALSRGKVMLGGASSTPNLIKLISELKAVGAELTIVDGALSRRSLASPAVTEATILCTGAAVSINIDKLVADTKHTFNMMSLPQYEESGNDVINIEGMLTDNMLEKIEPKTIVVQDFTRIFITNRAYSRFRALGGDIRVRCKSEVVAICFNPQSSNGYVLNSDVVTARLKDELGVNVYDVMKI